MEKLHKPINPIRNKRPRKISQSTTAVEPKMMKKMIKSDTLMKLKPVPSRSESAASKLSTIESIQIETIPLATQTPKKKKLKKLKDGPKPISPITSSGEPKKAKKRSADISQVNSAVTPASPLKKRKKRKQLLAELNELKEQVIGPIKTEVTDEKLEMSPGIPKKSKQKDAVDLVAPKEMNQSNADKYPILNDKEIIDKFMKTTLNNNQKGRIREAIKLSLQDTDSHMFPDIINGKIQAILNSSSDLTGAELRRIRILYNMLKTALSKPESLENIKPKKKDIKKERKEGGEGKNDGKKKGPKRYVVFLGNLPLDINKEMIMEHFRELNEHIVDIRLPKLREGTKSAIAYVELSNEPSYELALSKHHSMLGNKRIKVLYTTQKNSKISKGEAKSKSAKLIALQKAGKLVGSVPVKKKRSHRRAIMKQAKKAAEDKVA